MSGAMLQSMVFRLTRLIVVLHRATPHRPPINVYSAVFGPCVCCCCTTTPRAATFVERDSFDHVKANIEGKGTITQ